MPEPGARQRAILRWTEQAMDRVWKELFRKIEREMREQVARWQKRWPRHRFQMELAHGTLLATVTPPLCGQSFPQHVPGWARRGAIEDLIGEIESFDAFLDEIASQMGRPADGLSTEDAIPQD